LARPVALAAAFAVKHASDPTPPALRSPPRPAPSLARDRFAEKRASGSREGVRISAAPSSSSLALSPNQQEPVSADADDCFARYGVAEVTIELATFRASRIEHDRH